MPYGAQCAHVHCFPQILVALFGYSSLPPDRSARLAFPHVQACKTGYLTPAPHKPEPVGLPQYTCGRYQPDPRNAAQQNENRF